MKCSKGGAMILEPRNCDRTRHERCLRALVTSALVFRCGYTCARPAGPGPWSPVLILIGVVAQPADPTSQSPSLLSRTSSLQPGIIIWHCPQLGLCHPTRSTSVKLSTRGMTGRRLRCFQRFIVRKSFRLLSTSAGENCAHGRTRDDDEVLTAQCARAAQDGP